MERSICGKALLGAACMFAACMAWGQAGSEVQEPPRVEVALTYDSALANITTGQESWMEGGSLAGMTLTQLQALSGTLIISINGTPETSATISLSAATSFTEVATLILAGFTSPGFTVTFNTQTSAFVFTSSTTGASSSVSFATGTLASGLLLESGQGGVLSTGATAATPSAFMAALAAAQKGWAGFTTSWEPDLSDKESFSNWTSLQNRQYAYAGYDSDTNALIGGNTTTWIAAVNAANEDGTVPLWGTPSHGIGILSWMASMNFSQQNGASNVDFRSFSGMVPAVTTDAQGNALDQNEYMYYGQFANNLVTDEFFYGMKQTVTGQYTWLDDYVFQIWLSQNIQAANLALLRTVGKIPYNSAGNTMISENLAGGTGNTGGPIQQAIWFGMIEPGTALAENQIQDLINQVGFDISSTLQSQGYYLLIGTASPTARAARSTPPMTLYYCTGGSVQQLNIAVVEVQ